MAELLLCLFHCFSTPLNTYYYVSTCYPVRSCFCCLADSCSITTDLVGLINTKSHLGDRKIALSFGVLLPPIGHILTKFKNRMLIPSSTWVPGRLSLQHPVSIHISNYYVYLQTGSCIYIFN